MCINNKDYIGTIREKNGLLVVKEEKIKQDQVLISELEAMRENPNRTLLDMQRIFEEHYPSKVYKGKSFDYLYPNSYNSAYVSCAVYPNIMTSAEYLSKLSLRRTELNNEYLESDNAVKFLKKLRNESISKYDAEVHKRKEIIERKISEYKSYTKKHFKPERFIYAYNYYAKLKEICNSESLKVFSSDCVGWSEFEYKINEDITVMMKTNFGYGSSSYFFSNIKYKGVSILPYTSVVKYFYVRWTDFVRYTNKYAPCRDNWEYALHFVTDVANMAKTDPESFLEKWVVIELKEMMTGLRNIMNSDDAELAKFLNFKNEVSLGSYSLVRNCYNSDITEYKVLPQEKIMAFKAEKITGCLFLLENLMQFRTISSYVNDCINEIKSMNRRIVPDIQSHRVSLSSDIKRLQKNLDSINSRINEKTPKLEKHLAVIKHEVEKLNMDNKKSHIIYSFYDYERKYISSHPEYRTLKNEVEDLNQKAQEKKNDINLRQSFDDQLAKCLTRISKYLEIAC